MQIRSFLTTALLGALCAVAVGCATTSRAPPANSELDKLTKRENLPQTPGCFWRSDFQGDWTVLNESTLIVRAPLRKDAYVVKLFEPVIDLRFKQRLGFEDKLHTGRICDNGDDYLVVPGEPLRVPITAVRVLTKDQQTQLLQAAGKSAR